ncbi:MAG: hypothetical protein AB1390_08175 [Nitrospirota bacterium]
MRNPTQADPPYRKTILLLLIKHEIATPFGLAMTITAAQDILKYGWMPKKHNDDTL